MSKDTYKPKIRITGHDEDWEKHKLSSFVSYTASNLTVKDALKIGKFDLYDANTIIGKTNCEPMETDYISIIKDGAGVGRIRKLPKNTMFIGTMGALQCKEADLSFVYSLLSKFKLGERFSGSTIPHIYFKDYGNNDYYIPQIEEQIIIGQYFDNIDNLILLHQRELDKLVCVRKAMVEKMFPQNGNDIPTV